MFSHKQHVQMSLSHSLRLKALCLASLGNATHIGFGNKAYENDDVKAIQMAAFHESSLVFHLFVFKLFQQVRPDFLHGSESTYIRWADVMRVCDTGTLLMSSRQTSRTNKNLFAASLHFQDSV